MRCPATVSVGVTLPFVLGAGRVALGGVRLVKLRRLLDVLNRKAGCMCRHTLGLAFNLYVLFCFTRTCLPPLPPNRALDRFQDPSYCSTSSTRTLRVINAQLICVYSFIKFFYSSITGFLSRSQWFATELDGMYTQ